jgi:hypothetical protein
MSAALLIATVQVDAVGKGGVLTLIFPLVLLPIIVMMWLAWWRRRSRDY